VGIRTASYAFAPKDKDIPGERTWWRFDKEVLGVDY
jgi:hypothetical protein